MRTSSLLLLFPFLFGCGEKTPPVAPVSGSMPVTAAPPVVEPEIVPEAPPVEAPPSTVENASLQVTITRADGSVSTGRVIRIERSTDWFGEADWSTDAKDIVLNLEGYGTETTYPWSQVKLVKLTPGKMPDDQDCSYDSDYTPWMYDCTFRTTSAATTSDGKTWNVLNRHKWRFTFDNGQSSEFWLQKHPVRKQDAPTVGEDVQENSELYEELQVRLHQEVRTLVKTITITP